MRKLMLSVAACAAMVGVALAQVEASSSSTYLLDIDPARYAGPVGQRLALRVGDPPRHVTIGSQEQVCVQLERASGKSDVITARVRTLVGEELKVAEVKLVGPDVSPGTYRSTPWGLLLRALPEKTGAMAVAKAAEEAPVCTI